MDNNKIYFTNDYNPLNDPKLMVLKNQLGMEGYGVYWALIEIIQECCEEDLPLEIIPVLAEQFKVEQSKILSVINDFGLFEVVNNCFKKVN